MANTKPPKRTIPASESRTEPSPKESVIPQIASTHSASPSTKSLQIRTRQKRMRLKSPSPLPRHAPPQDPLSTQNPRASLSTLQKEPANPFPTQHNDLAENDLLTEQTHLLTQNAAALTGFVDPHTPPNPPRILTENGLLTHTPVNQDSPEENTNRKRRPQMVFGDWLPGCGPQTHNNNFPDPRGRDEGDDEEFVRPARMRLRLRGMYAAVEERDRALWVEMVLVVAGGSRDFDVEEEELVEQAGSEDVRSASRQPRPWEL